MGIDQRIILDQQHQVHLTTELKVGIAVLGMSALDLVEYVENNIEDNPFLDDDGWVEPYHPVSPEAFSGRLSTDALLEKTQRKNPQFTDGYFGEVKREYPFEKYLTTSETLESYLIEQLDIELDDEGDRTIARYLVGSLDQSGYLRITVDEAAVMLGVSSDRIDHVLKALQSCQPVGVGARSLSECLSLQLEYRGVLTLKVKEIVDSYLEELGAGRLNQVAKRLGISVTDVQRAYDLIRTCEPRPGTQFGHLSDYVWPEVIVEAIEDGYRVILQDFYLPHLKVNSDYKTLVLDDAVSGEVGTYLRKRLKEAEGLIDGISQRHATLYKVSCCIVELQREFFDKGFGFLRPLTMTQVATLLDVSESTVSRMVNGNYMQTPRGLFEMRYFFHSGLVAATTLSVSSVSIKHLIQELVSQEDSASPLSDLELVAELASRGVDISRRTINKYRTEMGIPVAGRRKRYNP